jgi:hypothetical protein
MSGRAVPLAICATIVSVTFHPVNAQHIRKVNDRQWIELAVDMIRKGVQQQDTAMVFEVKT